MSGDATIINPTEGSGAAHLPRAPADAAEPCARARAVTATASGRGIGSAPALHPGNAVPLDRDRLPGYIFSRSGGQAAGFRQSISGTEHYRVGATWIRRGWRGDGCVSRSHNLVKLWENHIIADNTYAMAA